MKPRLEQPAAPAEQPLRDQDAPRGLAQCPDVLTIPEVCREIQISRSHYYTLIRHKQFPIRPLSIRGVVRYGKAAVQAFLDGATMRRVG